ncbi:MAG TPA: acyltransferase [Tahibacter sp.]|uniref:LpxL/LpxP family acyltransferase n=1 Tax=Tahibacter sp. TaxID=2056211 RepID=UPI002C368B40|nr:acyltransferase [Tahibacter sp.]HSX58845.1 acyltransferase [Tahibacter sp.]
MSNPHWTDRPEGGGRFAIWLIRSIALYGGRPVARLFLYPITLYFYLRRRPEREASRAFLSRVLGRPAGTFDVMRHIHRFAGVILDRVFLLARDDARQFDLEIHGLDLLFDTYDQGRGMLLLGSHLGSFEILRVLARERPEIQLKVVLDKSQTPAITELLHALNPAIGRSVIDASGGGTAIVLGIKEAVDQGAVVALLGDRARLQEPTRQAPFLGQSAPLPVAPYLIASVLDTPVLLCFGLYRGGNRYSLHFEHFADRIEIPRSERNARLDAWLARYAQRLEHHARLDPYNWFNFYDFWHSDRIEPVVAAGEPRRA